MTGDIAIRTMPRIRSHMNAEFGLNVTFPLFIKSMNAAPINNEIPIKAKIPQIREINDATPTTVRKKTRSMINFSIGGETALLFDISFLIFYTPH
jgi:hypothetical protein